MQLIVVWSTEEVQAIIKDAHEGSGNSVESRSLQSHRGIEATVRQVCDRFYWRTTEADIMTYIKTCENCQKLNPKFHKEASYLHSVAVPKQVMQQIGIDISCLP